MQTDRLRSYSDSLPAGALCAAAHRAFAEALIAVFEELHQFLHTLSDAEYRRMVPGVFSASIGEHVRHSLDHVRLLLDGVPLGTCDYEARERGNEVEINRHAAMALIDECNTRLASLQSNPVTDPLTVVTMASSDGPTWTTRSSVERELAFVLSHTIHHNAIIAVAARELGVPVPTRFGYAPATVAHLEAIKCAPSP